MDAQGRRSKITQMLQESDKPYTGSELAQQLGVTRQIIVQDIAVLRASGLPLLSTTSGYLLIRETAKQRCIRVLNCYHTTLEEAEIELKTIVSLGGKVRDVMVEHPIYGEITGNLMLNSIDMVDTWLLRAKTSKTMMLSVVTNGYHSHTVETNDEETMNRIEKRLREVGILVEPSATGAVERSSVNYGS